MESTISESITCVHKSTFTHMSKVSYVKIKIFMVPFPTLFSQFQEYIIKISITLGGTGEAVAD